MENGMEEDYVSLLYLDENPYRWTSLSNQAYELAGLRYKGFDTRLHNSVGSMENLRQ